MDQSGRSAQLIVLYLTEPEHLGEVLPGEPRYRTDQLRDWLYRTPVLTAEGMTNLPKSLRGDIAQKLWPFELDVEQTADRGQTKKWLFRCEDQAPIESVLMGYANRTTLCISSQVGCAMGCTFCATGQFGFDRHLDAGEIVAQVAYANAYLSATPLPRSPERVTNVVFMGMGEPLANYANTIESIRRMINVMGMSARSITVSTVGFVPGMRQLIDEPWPVNLAVSLHSTIPSERSKLVPINDRYPIDDVVAAALDYYKAKGRRISLEWTLIADQNDSDREAVGLARIARQLRAHVNVIALNPTPLSTDRPPDHDHVRRFVGALKREGVNVTLRDTRGQDIDAACGQLRLRAQSG
ncbi:MAG: 23S rRNA (adenine(2503)-C(2))-methyltransferase RlmN [Acidimicrobiia bacterium]|nr:MAG: 23S rRNA (adenine(2503)-C(2))-methyltransferase RlmN [Acidimicrobiia bacterium]